MKTGRLIEHRIYIVGGNVGGMISAGKERRLNVSMINIGYQEWAYESTLNCGRTRGREMLTYLVPSLTSQPSYPTIIPNLL